LDTNGNVFGGFTAVKWESCSMVRYKCDESLLGFPSHSILCDHARRVGHAHM
jgi:hypothetical protein